MVREAHVSHQSNGLAQRRGFSSVSVNLTISRAIRGAVLQWLRFRNQLPFKVRRKSPEEILRRDCSRSLEGSLKPARSQAPATPVQDCLKSCEEEAS